jgi:hypothetical protein
VSLGAYLKAAAGTPWKAGEHDCSAWPARWAGIPIPAYSTDAEGEALIEAAGGLLPLWERWIGDALKPVHAPQEGDVGIIEAVAPGHAATQVGAIWTGRRWAFLTPRGLACASAVAVAVWRVECLRP